MRVDVGDDIVVIDGWIIRKSSKCVISKYKAMQCLSKQNFQRLTELHTKDIASLRSLDTTLLELENSGNMFSLLQCQLYQFDVMQDNTYHPKGSRVSKRNKKKIMYTVEKLCHRYNYGGSAAVYLCEKTESYINDIDMLDFDHHSRQVRDTSIFARVLKMDELRLNSTDYGVLEGYTREVALGYAELGEHILSQSYRDASAKASNHLGADYHTRFSSLIKKFDPVTITLYGRRLGRSLFTLFNSISLNCFGGHPFVDREVIVRWEEDRNAETIIQELGRTFQQAIKTNLYNEFLLTWIRLAAVDFEKWMNQRDTFPIMQSHAFRQHMDALRCLIRFCAFAVEDNPTELDQMMKEDDDDTRFYKVFRLFYTAVAQQERIITSTYVNIDVQNECVFVKNKKLSFDLIRTMKEDLHTTFMSCVGAMGQWLSYGSVARVYNMTLGNATVRVKNENEFDDRDISIYQALPLDLFKGMHIQWLRGDDAVNESIRKSLLDIINKMTKVLMVSMWLSPGMPLRFPELSIMTFSGRGRNLYVDATDRVFFIKSRYNKNRKFDSRLLFMDKVVSSQLLWFVYILRPFLVSLMQPDLAHFARSILISHCERELEGEIMDDDDLENPVEDNRELHDYSRGVNARINNADTTTGNSIIKQFLFVDVKNLRLVDSNAFAKILSTYPLNPYMREGHRIGTMRQGLAAIWKHMIMPDIGMTGHIKSAIAASFGHNVATHTQLYGVHGMEDTPGDQGVFDYYTVKKLCQEFQSRTAFAVVNRGSKKRDRSHLEQQEEEEDYKPAGDILDLVAAGKEMYNDDGFEFRTNLQREFTGMVLTSERKLLTLQAATAFGKSLTFLLPIMVLKKLQPETYVHFIGVPYESLKMATIEKVHRCGDLVARDISMLNLENSQHWLLDTDVFVGCFDSFGTNSIASILKNWESSTKGERKKGYLIFDEVHVLWVEKTFRPSFRQIFGLGWRGFLKMVFLSATIPEDILEIIAKDRGISNKLLEQSSRYINGISEVPNKDVRFEVVQVNYPSIRFRAAEYIRRYLAREETNGKAIFFFTSIPAMMSVQELVDQTGSVAMVSSNTPDTEKQKIFEQFENPMSPVKVILGTKLISNGLDCPSVNFVCLVNCRVTPIDFLQMAGRLRKPGLVRIIDYKRRGGSRPVGTDEIAQRMNDMNWDECVTKQIAQFYGIENPGCLQCCDKNNDLRDPAVERTVECLRNRGEEEQRLQPQGVWVTPARTSNDSIFRTLLNRNTNIIRKELAELLQLRGNNFVSIKEAFLGIRYHDIVYDFFDVPPSMCRECFMARDKCMCGTEYGKALGLLVCQYLIVNRIDSENKYERLISLLVSHGGYSAVADLIVRQVIVRGSYIRLSERWSFDLQELRMFPLVGNDAVIRFKQYMGKLRDKKWNVFDLVFGGCYERDEELYRNLAEFIDTAFRQREVVTRYSSYRDVGAFTTRRKDIVKNIVGHFKTSLSSSYSDEVQIVVLLLWSLHTQKVVVNRSLDSWEIPIDSVIEFFPVFMNFCLEEVKYCGQMVKVYQVLLDCYFGTLENMQF